MPTMFPHRFAAQSLGAALLGALSVMPLTAQGTIVPAILNGVEGGSGTSIPFGSNQACRYQCLYDAAELPWSGPRLINGISIRADNGSPTVPGAAMNAKGYVEISVLLSTTYVDAAGMSATFETNRGRDAQWVLLNERIMLPAQPATSTPGPRAANIDLNFTTPWFYGLTPARPNQPAPANLLVELWIAYQPAGAYRIDNLSGCQAQATDFGNQDPTCTVPGMSLPPVLSSSSSMNAGGAFSWSITNAPANAPFLVAVNSTNQGGLFGQPALALPFPLFDPNNPTQPPPGLAALRWPAPGCWLNIDPIATFVGVCDAAGAGSVTTFIPSGRQNVGTTFYGQAIALAPTANQLGLVTTRGRHSTVCG
ncbi:MAG: hypothetical protein RL398_3297, partial [Planctomycetota bacterium]